MPIKFGEIDATQILENEFRIGVLESIFDWFTQNNESLAAPNRQTLEQIHKAVVERLQKKYPNSGVSYKGLKNA